MTRAQTPGKPGRERDRKRKRATAPAGAWSKCRDTLAAAIASLQEDDYLIVIASRAANHFVQFYGHGALGLRLEAVSNTYLEEGHRLSDAACLDLLALGWNPPTYVPAEGVEEPKGGSPNFYLDMGAPVPHARVAALAVETLRTIYRVQDPRRLAYEVSGKAAI